MQIVRAFPSAERVVQVLETKVDITEPDIPTSPKVVSGEEEFKDVNFSYSKNGEYVLKNISFVAKAGETIGIIGSAGSGELTSAVISCLYDPDSGAIFIDGINLKEYETKQLRSLIGFVPQKATLFTGTIESNLRMEKRMQQLLRLTQLHKRRLLVNLLPS